MDSQKDFWIGMIKHDENYYILSDEQGKVISFPIEEKALSHFTDGYSRAQSRGSQGIAASIIGDLKHQPRAVKVNLELIAKELLDEEKGFMKVKFGGLGFSFGLECNRGQEDIERIYNSGNVPDLVDKKLYVSS